MFNIFRKVRTVDEESLASELRREKAVLKKVRMELKAEVRKLNLEQKIAETKKAIRESEKLIVELRNDDDSDDSDE